MAIKKIKELVLNEQSDLFAIVQEIKEKTSSNGSYIEIRLLDDSGSIISKKWNTSLSDVENVTKGTVIKARGILKKSGDFPAQFILEQIRPIVEKDEINEAEFTCLIPVKPTVKIEYIESDACVFGLVKLINEKISSNGNKYINVILQDSTGVIDAKIWDTEIKDFQEKTSIVQGSIVFAEGKAEVWDNKKKFIISEIHLVKTEEIKEEDFIKISPLIGCIMYDQILKYVNGFKNEELKMLIKFIYEKYQKELIVIPASQLIHHDEKSGLLFHKFQMLRTALAIGDIYFQYDKIEDLRPVPEPEEKEIDKQEDISVEKKAEDSRIFFQELLSAGVLLHDIGKILELDTDEWAIVRDYSKKGKLLGHMILGNDIITEVSKELNISDEVTTLVKHMIISHHFEETWGAYIKPQTVEAELLHHLDLIDSKIYQFKQVLNVLQKGLFSEKQVYLNNRSIYRPEI